MFWPTLVIVPLLKSKITSEFTPTSILEPIDKKSPTLISSSDVSDTSEDEELDFFEKPIFLTSPSRETTSVDPLKNSPLFSEDTSEDIILSFILSKYFRSASTKSSGEIVNSFPSVLLITISLPEYLKNFASIFRPSELVHVRNGSSAMQSLQKRNNAKTEKENFTTLPNQQQSSQSSHEDKLKI